MSIDAATKKKIIDEYATSDGDTGSPEVQVANPHQADRPSHRASQRAQARPPQQARPDAVGWTTPPPAQLRGQDRHRALPVTDRTARAPSVICQDGSVWLGSTQSRAPARPQLNTYITFEIASRHGCSTRRDSVLGSGFREERFALARGPRSKTGLHHLGGLPRDTRTRHVEPHPVSVRSPLRH